MNYWKNKRVLITGGTSGLGQQLAHQLLHLKAQVAVVARHRPDMPVGYFIAGDVSDQHQTHRIYAEAVHALGGVDVLINNASTLGPTPLRLLMDTECEDLALVLQTNLVGPFRLTKLAVAGMIINGHGVVINISSDAAVSVYPRWGAYSVSKAALDHMTRIFQAELQDTGVRFVALDPGDMDTPMHLAAIPEADRAALYPPSDSAQKILAQIASEQFQPLRRSLR